MVPTVTGGYLWLHTRETVMFEWHVALIVRMCGKSESSARMFAWLEGKENLKARAEACDTNNLHPAIGE